MYISYMYVLHFMEQSCFLHSGKRNTAWSPSWELLLSGLSTYVRSGFNLISTLPKTSWGLPFDESSRDPISTFNGTQAVGIGNNFMPRK